MLRAARDYAYAQGINAEFSLHRECSSLVRLGNSAVALSTSEDLTRLDVQVTDGRKMGEVGINADITSLDQLKDALHRAQEYCAASLAKDYDPIFAVVEDDVDDSRGYDDELATLSTEAKTALCAEVIHAVAPRGSFDFSGSWSSGSTEIYLITTANEHEAYRRLTDGRLALVLKDTQQKWELSTEQTGKRAADFVAAGLIDEFNQLLPIYQANSGYATPLGATRVLFGPQAIAELVGMSIWGGFSGRGWEEKLSFTAAHQFGDTILSPKITLVDDPTHQGVYGMPFDLNGKLRKPFSLVEQGVFRGLFYDSATAARYHKLPTGHDVSSTDLVLATGDAPAGMQHGLALAGDALYIPHLHYTNMPDPARGLFTGSSRFNALLVKDGRFSAPLLSTRITDTIPNILSHVVAVSSRAVTVDVSTTYGRRAPDAICVPEYILCDNVRISDVAASF
jgi:predicted Zn-dependent protease